MEESMTDYLNVNYDYGGNGGNEEFLALGEADPTTNFVSTGPSDFQLRGHAEDPTGNAGRFTVPVHHTQPFPQRSRQIAPQRPTLPSSRPAIGGPSRRPVARTIRSGGRPLKSSFDHGYAHPKMTMTQLIKAVEEMQGQTKEMEGRMTRVEQALNELKLQNLQQQPDERFQDITDEIHLIKALVLGYEKVMQELQD